MKKPSQNRFVLLVSLGCFLGAPLVFLSCAKIITKTPLNRDIQATPIVPVQHFVSNDSSKGASAATLSVIDSGPQDNRVAVKNIRTNQWIKNFSTEDKLPDSFQLQSNNSWLEIEWKSNKESMVARLAPQTIISYFGRDMIRLHEGKVLIYSTSQFYELGVQTKHTDVYPLGATYYIQASNELTSIAILDGTVRLTPLGPIADSWAQVNKTGEQAPLIPYISQSKEVKQTRFNDKIPQRGCRDALWFSRGFLIGSMGDIVTVPAKGNIYAARFDLTSFNSDDFIKKFPALTLGRNYDINHFVMRQNRGYLCEKSEQNYNENQKLAQSLCGELSTDSLPKNPMCGGIILLEETKIRIEYR